MNFERIRCAFKNRLLSGRITNTVGYIDPRTFLEACKMLLILTIGEFFLEYRSAVKVNVELACEYVVKKGLEETVVDIYFVTQMSPLTISEDFSEWFSQNVLEPILRKMSEFQERESGKALKRMLHLQVSF